MNILCPHNQPCIDDSTSLGNYSSEEPDVELFRATYFPNQIWDDDFDIWRACFGLCVSTVSQAEADLCAQNNAKICELNKQYGNLEQTCTRTCSDGSVQSKTIPADTFWAETQAQANALATNWCNNFLSQLCGSVGPNPTPAPNPGLPAPNGKRACNDAQTGQAPCVNGGRGAVVAPCAEWASSKAAANIRALALLENYLTDRVGCLTDFPKTVCLNEDIGERFIVPDKVSAFTAPYTWDVFGAVPSGLTFTPNGLAMKITGTFGIQQDWAFRLTLTDSKGMFTYRNYTVSVMEINEPDTLPNATQDAPYSQAISTVGGTDPKVFSVVTGYTLPAGLSLDAATGVISGTPEDYGTTSFRIRVADKYLGTCEKDFTLTILPNIFSTIIWNLLTTATAPGYGYATGTYGDVNVGAVTPAGPAGGGGTGEANTLWGCVNLTGSPINSQLRIVVTRTNGSPPAASGIQTGFADAYFMFHVETATVIANSGGGIVFDGTYTFPFTIPVGVSTWQISFRTGAAAAGPPFPGGTANWDVFLEII